MRISISRRSLGRILLGVASLLCAEITEAGGASGIQQGFTIDRLLPESEVVFVQRFLQAQTLRDGAEAGALPRIKVQDQKNVAMAPEASPLSFVAGAFVLFGTVQVVRSRMRRKGQIGSRHRISRLSDLTQRRDEV